MSYYPIELDKTRNFKFGMRAIDSIEKKLKKKIHQIDGVTTGQLSMEEYATIIWAGLVHEDKNLTPSKIMDLVDEYSNLGSVTEEMWKAFNSMYAGNDGTEEEDPEETKNE